MVFGILKDYVYRRVEFQSIYRVGLGGICVVRDAVDVIAREVVAFRWWLLVKKVVCIACRPSKVWFYE